MGSPVKLILSGGAVNNGHVLQHLTVHCFTCALDYSNESRSLIVKPLAGGSVF